MSTSFITLPTRHFSYGKHWCPPLSSPCPHDILVMENTGVHLFHHPAHTFLLPCPHISVMEKTGVHLFGQTAHTKYLLWKTPVSTSLITLPTHHFCYGKQQHLPLWSPCPHIISVMENSSIYLFGHPAHTSFLLWKTAASTSLVTLPTLHFCSFLNCHLPLP